ncbi:hypothetical protein ACFPZL_06525 [Leucobacter soli]|uniref:Uncharacterized protein n=1 Tax=Leucobacter soli TaxID=2812850 RepID=A0A916K158_9MICO|nr:hypothetical protein [Leucobacter soli]CAG7616806.1 hypothetical protein LEUCIP111803_02027 [Leucobacter soli]
MNTSREPRRQSRSALWLTAIAIGSALALGVSGCTPDTANLAKKAVGDEQSGFVGMAGDVEPVAITDTAPVSENEVPTLADKYEPMAALDMPKGKTDLTQGLNAGQKQALQSTQGVTETVDRLRIHLTIASPQVTISRFGETYGGKQRNCLDLPWSTINIPAGTTGESCTEITAGTWMSVEQTYRLPGTTDLLWIYVKNPLIGNPELQCNMFDPRTWKPVDIKKTKYTCDVRWMQHGYWTNPMPRVRVTAKNVVEVKDAKRAQQLLTENCSKKQPECDYTSTRQRVVSPPESEWTLLDTYTNCGPDRHESAEHKWAQAKTFQGAYTIGGAISGGYGNPAHDKVSAKIKASFKHIWKIENSYKAVVKQPVPYGKTNLFYAQLSYLELTGDFVITTKDNVYIITDTVYKLPLSDEYKDEDGNRFKFLEKHSMGADADCASIAKWVEEDHGHKKTVKSSKVQKLLNSGVIPSASDLLAAGATLETVE